MGTNYYMYKNDDQDTQLHIGKSSYGWVFSLRVYPKDDICDLYDWIELFLDKNAIIRDEYSTLITPEKMMRTIMCRGRDKPVNWSEKDWIANSAEPGPNNLVRFNSALMGGQFLTKVWPGEGTWDYCDYEFF